MKRRQARGGNKWLEKVRERNSDELEEERKLRERLSKAKRDRGTWNKTKEEEKKVKRSRGKRREGARERERMTSFPKHNEDIATVAFSRFYSRSSSAPLTSSRSTSPQPHPQVAPSAPVGGPGSWCSLPWTVTDPPYLKHIGNEEARSSINEARHLMYAEATSSKVWDVTEHVFAAGKHSDPLSIFEYIGSSMNASQWCRLHRAINNNDNRLHLIEVFREAVL